MSFYKIFFSATIYSEKRELMENLPTSIQFFNAKSNQWLTLIENAKIEKGSLQAQLEIPSRILRINEEIRIIRDTISSGAIPTFRLIESRSPRMKATRVISMAIEMSVNNTTRSIDIDFGDSTYTTKEKHIALNESTFLVASKYTLEEFIRQEKTRGNEEIKALKITLDEKVSIAQSSQNDLKKSQAELTKFTKLLNKSNSSLEKLKEKYNALKEASSLNKKKKPKDLPDYETRLTELNLCIAQQENTISNLRNENRELNNSNTEIRKVKEAIEKDLYDFQEFYAKENPNKVEGNQFMGEIARQFSAAQKTLSNTDVKLGSLSVKLKALVTKSPKGLSYETLDFDNVQKLPAEALSTIELELTPDQPVYNESPVPNLVPDLLGLTETAVRKRLSRFGLKLNPVFSGKEVEGIVNGQSYKQIPTAGSESNQEKIITVFFNRKTK